MISTDFGRSSDESAPDLERATDRPPHQQLHDQRRRPTFSVHRVLVCYAVTAIAVACGAVVAVAGSTAAHRCTDPGYTCLGYYLYGVLCAALLTAAVLLVLALVCRLGPVFWVVTSVLLIGPGLLSGLQPVALTAAVLGPGIAAWVTDPPRQSTAGPTVRVLRRVAVLSVVVVVLPMLIHVVVVGPYRSLP